MSAFLRMKRFLIGFTTINMVVLLCLALCFFWLVPTQLAASISDQHSQFLSYGFLMTGLIGQVGMFGLIFIALSVGVILGLRAIFKSEYYDFFWVLIASIFMTLLVLFVAIDFAVYRLMGYHLTQMFWNVLFSGVFFQVVVLSNVEWLILFAGFCLVLTIETTLAAWLWRKAACLSLSAVLIGLVGLIFLAAGVSYTIYFTFAASDPELPQLAKLIPYFSEVAKRWHMPFALQRKLVYPQHKLIFKQPAQPLNILMIVIDTWRSDMLNHEVTPHIARFAAKSMHFTNHFSGGNYTRPGIFSLLYGLSPKDWYQIKRREQGPLLIHQLLKEHYSVKILPSASPRFPDFIDTAFREVPEAWHDTPGANSAERDLEITNEFEQFLATRDVDKPFFGFLFYDAVHNWCGGQQPYATPFQPAIAVCNRLRMSNTTNPQPYLNRYRNAAHYDDELIGNILNQLTQRGLLKHTVVMITADHGEEFNDSRRGIWGHGSAFDRYQLQVPFVLYWPGKKPQVIAYRTSHYDVVPTLMRGVLGCVNASSDYSVGRSLFVADPARYIVVNSGSSYAKLFAHSFEVYYPGGFSVTTDLNGHY